MQKIASFFMSILAFFGITINQQPVPHETVDDFVPVVRFMACSDTHINSETDEKLDRIKNAIAFSYQTAENDANYKELDAVMFVGDMTDGGEDVQFEAFESTVKSSVKDGTEILAIAAKGHDSSANGKKSTEWAGKINGIDSDFNIVINGYHFIGLSTSKKESARYDNGQLTWLKKQLKEAANEDPDKPIFVFEHEHVTGTVYGSRANEGWGVTTFKNILNKYPQVVHLSGHSHYPLNDPRSIWQGNYTAIGTSSIYYMELTVDADRTVHPDGNNYAQAWLIEVDSSNRIRLRGFDVINSEWLCEYYITDPGNKNTYTFTPANQKALSSAPVFDESAKVSLKQEDNKCLISFPAADSTDGNPIFLYRIYVYDKNGIQVHSQYFISNYWSSRPAETISLTVDTASAASVKVLAENAYGMQSATISSN